MRLADLHQRLADLGARPVHRDAIIRAWLQGRALADAGTTRQKAADVFPKSLREGLAQLAADLDALAVVRSEHPGGDGSARLLVDIPGGQMIETVLLPRDGVCVSSQVGCAVACRFCMTGRSGLLRQVSSLEIAAQVVQARRRRPVRKVVFMGMGEPAHNLDNVLEAIELLGTHGGIGHKNLVFSTVGDARVFERLPQLRVKPGLALSLHTTRADLREHLLPKAPKLSPDELMALGEAYAREVGYPIQVQWTLLKGINDGDDELEAIPRLFAGKYAVLNLIPFNAMEGEGLAGDDYRRPDGERIVEMVRYLSRHGVLTKVRNSAGQDVDGGCGQLRARAERPERARRLAVVNVGGEGAGCRAAAPGDAVPG